jgi:diguanylate cyclase (GGDEF)-like protein
VKTDGVLVWGLDAAASFLSVFPDGSLPFAVVPVPERDPGALSGRLSREAHDVLVVEDAPPFERTRELLLLTDGFPARPVVIAVAPAIDVPTAVELMERGVFSVVSDLSDPRRLAGLVKRALDNRRAFQQIVNMNRSLQRSRSFLEKKSVALSAERVKLRRKASEVSLMRRVAEWLGRAKSLEDGLTEVLAPLAAFVGAERGVFLVNPEKGRWAVSGGPSAHVAAASFPRTPALFRSAVRIAVSADGGLVPAPSGPEAGEMPGIALPIRVKRRFLGYGVFWGGDVSEPSPDTLRLLEAVGVQVGAFCENIVLREQVATERDRLSHARDELKLLFHLASFLNADPDLDAVFEWLCRELGRFVPYTGIEFLSLLGKPEFRGCGIAGLQPRSGKLPAALLRQWRRQMPEAFEGAVAGDVRVKEFPYGDAAAGRKSGGIRWASPLMFGEQPLGSLAVHTAAHVPHELARERILKSVTAQLSLFLHNFAEREKVRIMASHDALTGLFNYRSFQDRFDREFEWFLRRERNLSMLMIDVDHFKGINDTFGHQVGDQVLRGVADILRQNLRKTDYAFRYGGDEFAVLMPEAGIRNAEVFAQRVRHGVLERLQGVGTCSFRLTLSIGIADCTVLASRAQEELLKRADGALYQAKARGRDRIQVAERPSADPSAAKEVPIADRA